MVDFSKHLKPKLIVACDIETSCGVKSCPGYGEGDADENEAQGKCKHALHHKHNKIDIIGVYDGKDYFVFTETTSFDAAKHKHGWQFIFHGGKFDYKSLVSHGSKIAIGDYVGDTQCLGACVFNKVTDGWLKIYNEKRGELNALLPKGHKKHRVGTPLSLKSMAPYYLGIPPFWENTLSHNDIEYNKKDCVYTYELHQKLLGVTVSDGTRKFYEDYLIPWQKLLCESELEGVMIDEKLLHMMYGQAVKDQAIIEGEVHEQIRSCHEAYRATEVAGLTKESEAKCAAMCEKLKDKSKVEGTIQRYEAGLKAKIEKLPTQFNLASPKQMLDILMWAGIDTSIDKKDKETNRWIETEGTNKFVLKRAKVKGNKFAEAILKFREKETEVQYLKQYINSVVGGRIHCTFSIVGTRTGRLSSSGPNLQNVKGSLRAPFIIADPSKYRIYTVDASQIEPRAIAYLTGDAEMVSLFRQGRDFHNYATKKFFPRETEGVKEADIKEGFSGLRKTAKIGDLSIIYGTGKHTFQTMALVREEMDIPLEECDQMVNSFRAGMKEVLAWKKRLETSYKDGTKIKDRFGFPVVARQESIHMTLFNAFVQGMSSRMIFHGSLMADREFVSQKIDAKPLLWVHDEVVWRFPVDTSDEDCKRTVDHYMCCYKLDTPHGRVPLAVEGKIADRWEK